MPLFHTMGMRILLGRALLNGRLVCVPDYSPEEVLRWSSSRAADDALSGAHHVSRRVAPSEIRRVRPALAVARRLRRHEHDAGADRALPGASSTPELFVNYYGSSEIYTFSYCDHLDRKPGCAGRAGMNQIIRVRLARPRRRHRGRSAARRVRRDRRQHEQPGSFRRILEAARCRRQGHPGPLVSYRRPRQARRGRRALRGGPRGRHDHQRAARTSIRRKWRTCWRAAVSSRGVPWSACPTSAWAPRSWRSSSLRLPVSRRGSWTRCV